MYNAAKLYSQLGWIVHPLSSPNSATGSPGKTPLLKGWASMKEPLQEAELKRYFQDTDNNIGLICGLASGITAIDFDDLNFYGEITVGLDSTKWIISSRAKKDEHSNRGHILFKYDPDLIQRMSKKFRKDVQLLGIDILSVNEKGGGSNVVIPPSIHISGGVYHFNRIPETLDDIPMMPIEFKTRLLKLIEVEDEFFACAKRCRKWVQEFLGNPSILHGGDGRRCMLALTAELKNNGLSDEGVHFLARVVYRNDYNKERTEKELQHVEPICWKSETLISNFPEYCNESNTLGYSSMSHELIHMPKEPMKPLLDDVDWDNLAEAAIGETLEVIETSNMTHDELYAFNLKNCLQVINDNTGECIINPTIASRIIMDRYHGFSYNGTVFIYNGTHYEKGEMRIRKEICSCIQMNAGERIRSVSLQENNVILMCSHSYLELEYTFNRHPDLINCLNGVIKIDFDTGTITLLPHSHVYRFDYCLPVNYDSSCDGNEIHEQCLSKWVSEEKEIDELYQIPAQALIQKTNNKPFKKAYLIQGDPHGGKSTYLELLRKMFGDNMFAAQSLQDIAQDRFAISSLENKAFNAYDDLTDVPMAHVGKFKTLTGAYDHEIEAKYQPKRPTKITAVHIFTCNAPPIVDDNVQRDTAFWERWEFIKFNSHFDVDPTFNDRMFSDQNLSGFLNRILHYIIKIHNNNRLVVISSVSEVREQWNLSADPLYEFIKENFDGTPTVMYLEKDKLLNALLQWARDNDKDMHKVPQTKTKLTRAIDKYMFHEKRVRNEQGIETETYECHAGMWILNSKYQFAKVKLLQKQSRI